VDFRYTFQVNYFEGANMHNIVAFLGTQSGYETALGCLFVVGVIAYVVLNKRFPPTSDDRA
jgi:predicted MFS family arabinose efflux permease